MRHTVTVTLSFPSDHVLRNPQAGLRCCMCSNFAFLNIRNAENICLKQCSSVLRRVQPLFPPPRSLARVRDEPLPTKPPFTQAHGSTRVFTDFVQDLYIRELKSYKPAPAVRVSPFSPLTQTHSIRFANIRQRMPTLVQ